MFMVYLSKLGHINLDILVVVILLSNLSIHFSYTKNLWEICESLVITQMFMLLKCHGKNQLSTFHAKHKK